MKICITDLRTLIIAYDQKGMIRKGEEEENNLLEIGNTKYRVTI